MDARSLGVIPTALGILKVSGVPTEDGQCREVVITDRKGCKIVIINVGLVSERRTAGRRKKN